MSPPDAPGVGGGSGTSAERLDAAMAAVRRAFRLIIPFSLAINLLMLVSPLYMMQLFDRVLTSRSLDTLLMLFLIAVLALLVMGVLEGVRSQVLIRLGVWLDRRIGADVLSGGIAAALRQGAPPSAQPLRDVTTLRGFLSGPGIFPLLDAPWAPVFLAVIFLLHPWMGFLSLAGALLLFGLGVVNELITREPLKDAGQASIQALQRAESALRNADAIESMGMSPNVVRRWREDNIRALALQAEAGSRSGIITAASKALRLLLQIGILSVGAYLAIDNQATPGAMIAGSILMGRALAPVEQAIGTWRSLIAARQAHGRLKAAMARAPARQPGMPLPTPRGRLEVEDITFGHPGSREPQLRGVGFGLEPGEAMGLIGPTAAGKTTLARLIVGNLVPRHGQARLDGMDVARWNPDDRGRHVGYLPQDVELFGGTVRENIARMADGDPDAVVEAAILAGAHDMILRLGDGYDTPIGEGGMALSGGQRQRIGFARALYGTPRLVVLDEPSSNLDREGEAGLLRALDRLSDLGVTLVIIAHKPALLDPVHKVLVLRDGRVADFGDRDDIVGKLRPAARMAGGDD